jgi:hypothetical protein
MPFPPAAKRFSENSFFELRSSRIYQEEISNLLAQIKYLKKRINPNFPYYQLHLSNVQFTPGYLPRAEPQPPEQVLTGAITEHNARPWNERLVDVALTQMTRINVFNTPLNIVDREENREELADLKHVLFSLLGQPLTWDSIKLDHVSFDKKYSSPYSSEQFHNEVLKLLTKNTSLIELYIKPFSLSKNRAALVSFLILNPGLEYLHLEISDATKTDWIELCQVIAVHHQLAYLDLSNSTLDAHAYSALTDLLDENYRIEITLPEPTDEDLLQAYEPLKQRLSKSGLERFTEDHLSQAKLLQITVMAIESKKKFETKAIDSVEGQTVLNQILFLLSNQDHPAITDRQKESWVKGADALPSIYRNHPEYLKAEPSLLQLHLDKLAPGEIKTVGYVLLEKALEAEDLLVMRLLLRNKVNLFELPSDGEEPFLVKVLQNKGPLKEIVVDYIQRDQRLVTLASERLNAYPKLETIFSQLKTHVDNYSLQLVKKENSAQLIFFAKEIFNLWRKISGNPRPSMRQESIAKAMRVEEPTIGVR